MVLILNNIQKDSSSIFFPILLASIPALGAIGVAVLRFLVNKHMEITKEINSRKRKIYEEFLNAILLTQFGDNLKLLIDPSNQNKKTIKELAFQ